MPTAAPRPLLALVAGVLLLTGCGSVDAASGPAGPSGEPTCTPAQDSGDRAGTTREDVVLLTRTCGPTAAPATHVAVTNSEAEALDYTLTLALLNDAGQALDSVRQTVEAVPPDRTVEKPVEYGTAPGGTVSRVRIQKVRVVPTDQAPTGPCPPSGMRITTDRGSAAMGLRQVGLNLANCGDEDLEVEGYPDLTLLDEDREPVTGVRILHGTDQISSGTGVPGPPGPVTLRPGESASSSLAWRNTTQAGVPVHAPYVEVATEPGTPARIVTPELDLGTTGELGVNPWQKDDPAAPERPAAPDGPPSTAELPSADGF